MEKSVKMGSNDVGFLEASVKKKCITNVFFRIYASADVTTNNQRKNILNIACGRKKHQQTRANGIER